MVCTTVILNLEQVERKPPHCDSSLLVKMWKSSEWFVRCFFLSASSILFWPVFCVTKKNIPNKELIHIHGICPCDFLVLLILLLLGIESGNKTKNRQRQRPNWNCNELWFRCALEPHFVLIILQNSPHLAGWSELTRCTSSFFFFFHFPTRGHFAFLAPSKKKTR